MPRLANLETRGGRLAVFSLLYLSEGIPVGFSTVALAALLRLRGAGLDEVGAIVAATYLPWGLKWAWAPLVDLIRIPRLGPSRAWILLAQLMMIATLALILGLDVTERVGLLATLVIVHNVFAATQDVAIDALAVRVLPASEVGTANGLMFGSQFLGIGIGGSGALLVSGYAGFEWSLLFILTLLALILVGVTIPLREPPDPAPPPELAHAPGARAIALAVGRRIAVFFREIRRGFFGGGIGPVMGAVFSILPPGATALGLALFTAIQVDLGLSEATIGGVALATNMAGAAGSVLGGWLADRTGRPRACIAIFYALTALPTLYLASALTGTKGLAGLTIATFVGSAVLYNLFFGMQQGTVTALFMRITNPAVAATQFTWYMALHNLAMSYSSRWQGVYADAHGYAPALRLDAAVAFVALLVLPWVVGTRREDYAVTEAAGVNPARIG
jgi:PAT family beta-lactamase induction signal transducer AmpG